MRRFGAASQIACWLALIGAGSLPQSALAQAVPASSAGAAASAPAISDYVKRQAESPFRWILINSAAPKPAEAKAAPAKPRSTEPAAERPAPAAPTAASLPVPVPEQPAVAAVTAATPVMAPLAPAPEPVVVAKRAEVPLPKPPEAALVVISQGPPDLPAKILRDLITESVKVKFTVLPDGSTANAAVTASTNRRMNDYILSAVNRWKYAPIAEAREHEVEMVVKP